MVYSGIDRRIKELRLKRGLTQIEFAKMLGVSKSVVSSYENAVHLPPYDILIKISKIFGVTCDYLLNNENRDTISVEGLTETQVQSIESIIQELRNLNQKP